METIEAESILFLFAGKCTDCRKQFSVTVGTVFERFKVPLNKWLLAVHLMRASKKALARIRFTACLA